MTGCKSCLSEEFAAENMSLNYFNPTTFVKPLCPCRWGFFVTYRILIAILMIVWLVIDIWDETPRFYDNKPGIWFIFATNWSFVILTFCTFLHAVLTIYYYCKSKKLSEGEPLFTGMPWSLSLLWIVYNVAVNAALVVSLSYWTFLLIWEHDDFLVTEMSYVKHSMNTAYVLIDMCICAIPIRLYHVLYPMAAGAIYTVFNAIYFANNGRGPAGKHYAYSMMDWRKPIRATVTVSLGFILCLLVQLILYGIYRLRTYVTDRCNNRRGKSEEAEHLGIVSSEVQGYHTIDEEGNDNPQLIAP